MEIIFIISLFVVAYLYASVGHGGASGYLALMAFYGVAPPEMKSSALVLNVFVSFIAFVFFVKGGFLRYKILLPFIITSVPLAFIGAKFDISPGLYRKILAVCLLIATAKILLPQKNVEPQKREPNIAISLFSGGAIGWVSGLIGIGGGILLSPLLILSKWTNIKESACISAAFIFLNSAAALIGLYQKQNILFGNNIYLWVFVAFTGGLVGSYIGSHKISPKWLQYFLCVVLVLASVKLMIQ